MKMIEKYYCEHCDKKVDSHVGMGTLDLPVMGRSDITVKSKVRVCDVCGNDCYDPVLDDAFIHKAYDIYRSRHNIIKPAQIKSIRKRYGLSQKNLAILLGWGEVTITRYETGSLPDDAHNTMLRLLQRPGTMANIVDIHGDRLSQTVRAKLEKRLAELKENATVAN